MLVPSLHICLLSISIVDFSRYKDDVEIFEEDGYDFEVQNQNASLKLQDVDKDDSGSYTVEIENSAGEISKTFTLNVYGNYFLYYCLFTYVYSKVFL